MLIEISKKYVRGCGLALTVGLVAAAPATATAAPAGRGAQTQLPSAYSDFLSRVGGSRFLTTGGVRMHYVESGPRSKPTLLLVHGSPDSVYSWRKVMPELAERYRVVAPDLVGFGRSGKPVGRLTWSTEIDYLTRFIKAKRLRDVTLVATDIGGLFSFAYAQQHPRNVAAIATWETVTAPIASYGLLASYCPSCVQFFQVPKDPVKRDKFLVGNPMLAQQVYGGEGLVRPLSGAELDGYGAFLATPQQRRNAADIGAEMPIGGRPARNFRIATAYARFLRTSRVPKLVLYGEPGSILPGATANGLGLPNARYASVGKGFHFLVEDAPAAVASQILKWRGDLARPTG